MSGTWEVKEEYRGIFLEESQDQIQEWEESLLELEKDSGNKEQIDRMFRSIHTLKGSAGFVGFEELQKMTHDLESALQYVRDEGLKLSPGMIEILFEGHDFAKRMIEAFSLDEPFDEDIDGFIAKIKSVEGGNAGESPDMEVESKTDAAENGDETESGAEDAGPEPKGTLYRVGIEVDVEGKEAFLRSLLVQQRLEEAGKVIKVIPSLEDLRVRGTEFKYEVLVKTEKTAEEIEKFLSLDQIRVTGVDEASETEQKDKTGPEDTGEQEKKVKTKSGSKVIKAEQVVRVPVEKLDVMMNLVGELVIQNSGFISTTGELSEQYGRTGLILDLEEKTESLAKIARDLQDAVMKVRMLPVATVFNRFNRVVRDLAKDRNKAVELVIYGEETEIDKKVIDRIGEPLVHLVRNAVDHGIETREERAISGKDSVGHIKLGAYQEGDHICIEVSDDGKGLDREKIETKAIEKGLLKQEDAGRMDDEEIFKFIFLPGFSTAAKVTDISGRGVGLDVVKRAVDEMGGVVRIKSERGRGTVTTISLPLTMAIIMAILVETSGALFAIPLSSVNEVIKVKRSEFHSVRQSDVIKLRDEVVSVVDLNEILEISDSKVSGMQEEEDREVRIVIVSYGGKKVGIGVDRLLGNEEIVIKSLSRHYKEIEGMIGASILGNGRIALILDVEAMVSRYYRDELVSHTRSSVKSIDTKVRKDVPGEVKIEDTFEVEEDRSEEDEEEEEEQLDIPNEDEGPGDEEEKAEDENSSLNLGVAQREAIEEINTAGAITASMSMTQFMNEDIRVSFPETKIVQLSNVAEELGGEEAPVGGIFAKIKGDISGGLLLVLPMEQVFVFSDLIYRRETGTTKEITEDEMSGLIEMGNILSASFIRAMADTTKLAVNQDVPEMSMDMCLSVIDSILARFNQPGDRILLTEAELYYSEMEQAVCHLLLFLDPDSMERLGEALVGEVREEVGGRK